MIVLGVDPGSARSAWVLIESRGGGTKPLSLTWLEGGMVESHSSAFGFLLDDLASAPDVIAVERISGYAFGATSQRGGGQAVVKHLLATAQVTGTFCELARRRGRVVEITAAQWRKTVCGRGNAGDKLIAPTVRRLVHCVPKRTNPHTRDALGCAIAAAWSRGGRA